jgi:hypothetical protein
VPLISSCLCLKRSSCPRSVYVGVQSVTEYPRSVLSTHSCSRTVHVGVKCVTGDPWNVLSIHSCSRSVHIGVQSVSGYPRIILSIHGCPRSVHVGVQSVAGYPRNVLSTHSCSRTVHVCVQSVTGDPWNVLSIHSCSRSVHIGVQSVSGDPRIILSIHSCPRSVRVGVQSVTGDLVSVLSTHSCPRSVHVGVQSVTGYPRSGLSIYGFPRSVRVSVPKPSQWLKIRSRQCFLGFRLMTLPCSELYRHVTVYKPVTFSKLELIACVLPSVVLRNECTSGTRVAAEPVCAHGVQCVPLGCACEGRLEDRSVRKRVPFRRLLRFRFLLCGDVTRSKERWLDVMDVRALLHAEPASSELSKYNFPSSITLPAAVFITKRVTFLMKQCLLTSWYSCRWSRNSPPYVIAGKLIWLVHKSCSLLRVPSRFIPTHSYLPVPCLLNICSYSALGFPQVPVPFVHFPIFRNEHISSKCCRRLSISSGWNSHFCYSPTIQTCAPFSDLKSLETECKTVHLIGAVNPVLCFKNTQLGQLQKKKRTSGKHTTCDVTSFLELWFSKQKQCKSDFDKR